MKRSTVIILLLLLFPVGAFLTMLAGSVLRHRNDDRGAGMFHGYVRGDVMLDDYTGIFRFEGRSEPKWHWSRPENYLYTSLDLEWYMDHEGTGTLDLKTLTLTTEERSLTLNELSLSDLLHDVNGQRRPPSETEIKALYELLVATGQGTLPPPRHHGHSFEGDPLDGHLTHFSLGWRIPHIVFAWPVVWLAIVIIVLHKRHRHMAAADSQITEASITNESTPSTPT